MTRRSSGSAALTYCGENRPNLTIDEQGAAQDAIAATPTTSWDLAILGINLRDFPVLFLSLYQKVHRRYAGTQGRNLGLCHQKHGDEERTGNASALSMKTLSTYRARIPETLDIRTTAEQVRFAVDQHWTKLLPRYAQACQCLSDRLTMRSPTQ